MMTPPAGRGPGESARYLIVNADDFGQTHGINRGVVAAIDHGIVSSASLMVRGPAAREAVEIASERPSVSLGLHIELGEWEFRDGEWVALYEVVPAGDEAAMAAEVDRQLSAFRRLTGRNPTHLDSHQHIHRRDPLRSITLDVARQLRIPVRHYSPNVRYCGAYYGQTARGDPMPDQISVERLIELLRSLPPGYNELGCHPGYAADLPSMYASERALEVQALCDPQLPGVLMELGIQIRSYHDVIAVSENRIRRS